MTVGLLSLVAKPTAFNGGRSQVQPNFLAGGGDYPFINHLRTSPNFSYLDNSGWPTPDQMTSDGLPVSPMTNSGWVTAFYKPAQADRPGNYYIVTTGSGTVAYQGGSFTAVSGVGNKLLVPGASIPNRSYNFYIQSTNAGTPLTYVAIVHEDDIAGVSPANLQSYIEGELFQPSYIQFLRAIRPAEDRFLNWQNGNFSNETSWASRKPTSYWSFAANRMVNQQFDTFLNCYVGWLGTCGGGNNAYSVSDNSGSAAPADKQYVTVKFPAVAVTCTSGANAQLGWPAHGLNTGDPFLLFRTLAGTAPGGVSIYDSTNGGTVTFYAIVVDANTIQFATTQANALASVAITTSSTGSGLLAQATVVAKAASSFSVASSNFTFPEPHLFATGDSISLQATGSPNSLPSNISMGGNYFAIASSPTVLQLAATKSDAIAGTAIVFTGSMAGTIIVVKNPQLNLNGTGNVPIKSADGSQVNTSSSSSGSRPLARTSSVAGAFGTLVYDADLASWLLQGSQDRQNVAAVTNGIPPEIGVKLCAKVGCHPWWVSPYLTLNYKSGSARGLTDYMPSLMAYARDNMPPWMKPTFEGYNENWNLITLSAYSQMKAFAFWSAADLHAYVGRYSSLLGQAAVLTFGGPVGSKCDVYIGLQGATFSNASNAASNNQRMLADQFVNNGPAVPAGYVREPAYKWCTYVGGANYYTPNLVSTTSGTLNESAMAAAWVANGSSLSDPLLTQYADTLMDSVLTATISGTTMNVTAASGQVFTAAMGGGAFYINGPGLSPYTFQVLSGPPGGVGSYTLNAAPPSGTYTLKCGQLFSYDAVVILGTNYVAWAQGTAQPGGKWGGVYQLKVKPYEGGYSPDLRSTSSTVNGFRWASKFVADTGSIINGGTLASGAVVPGIYNDLVAVGVERPSLFQLAGGNGNGTGGSASNVWSIMDPDRYIPIPPQMAAITAFNN